MTTFRVAIRGPYVVAHTRTVEAPDNVEAAKTAFQDAADAGLDLLYASAQVIEEGVQ